MTVKPKTTIVVSAGEIGQLQFNERSYAQRNVNVGGVYDILGPINVAVRVGQFSSLMIANTTTVGHYVVFGKDSTLAAPTGLSDGIFVPPKSYIHLSSGLNLWIRADSASVGAYKLQDFVVAQDDGR